MKTDTAHTPTPWDLMEGKTLIHIETPNRGDGSPWGEHIASIPKSHKADAAFIVRAVNCHEELLAVAKSFRAQFPGPGLENVDSVIARAEGR